MSREECDVKTSEQHVSELLHMANEQHAKSCDQHVSELLAMAASRGSSSERPGSRELPAEAATGSGKPDQQSGTTELSSTDRRSKDEKRSRDREDSSRRSSSRERHRRGGKHRRRRSRSSSSSDSSRERSRHRRRHRHRRRSRSRSRSRSRRRYYGRSGRRQEQDSGVDRFYHRQHHRHTHRPVVETYNIDYKSKRSRAGDVDRSTHRIDKQHLLEVARRNVARMAEATGAANASSTASPISAAVATVNADVNQLTAMCRRLRDEAVSPSNHPTAAQPMIKPTTSLLSAESRTAVSEAVQRASTISRTARGSQSALVGQSPANAVTSQFPVSSGEHHRGKEGQQSSGEKRDAHTGHCDTDSARDIKVDLNQIVADRLSAMKDLQKNPNDADAKQRMQKAVDDMKRWTGSDRSASSIPRATPASTASCVSSSGHFTGSTGARLLSASELASGQQAWVKKDQLRRALPVTAGLGRQLLMKMGWKPGSGLGRHGDGVLEPVLVDVKTDKRGLVADNEGRARKSAASAVTAAYARDMGSKNPISVLMEHCMKNQWPVPVFDTLLERGPPHKRLYIIKVTVNGQMYRGLSAVVNKKVAKAEAAVAALRALGQVNPPGGAKLSESANQPSTAAGSTGVQHFTAPTLMYSEFRPMDQNFVSASAGAGGTQAESAAVGSNCVESKVSGSGRGATQGNISNKHGQFGAACGASQAVFNERGSSCYENNAEYGNEQYDHEGTRLNDNGVGCYQDSTGYGQMEGGCDNSGVDYGHMGGGYEGGDDYDQAHWEYDRRVPGYGRMGEGYEGGDGYDQTQWEYDGRGAGYGHIEGGYEGGDGYDQAQWEYDRRGAGYNQAGGGFGRNGSGYDDMGVRYRAGGVGSAGQADYTANTWGQFNGSDHNPRVKSNGKSESMSFVPF